MRAAVGLFIAAASVCVPAPLVAQDACVFDGAEPDALQLTPVPGGAEPATVDSPIVARFASDVAVADFEPEVLLKLVEVAEDGSALAVEGAYATEPSQPNVLVFQPTDGLSPESSYRVELLDPLDGSERALSFATGDVPDEDPPHFAESARLTLRGARSKADCDGFRVDVVFAPALDDGPRGSIEHLVYQTRGAGLKAPVLRSRVRPSMGSDVSTSFLLDADQALDPVCVLVLPVDGTGRVGEPLGPRCFAPAGSARFVGLCTSRPASTSGGLPLLGLPGLALALVWRRLRAHGRS